MGYEQNKVSTQLEKEELSSVIRKLLKAKSSFSVYKSVANKYVVRSELSAACKVYSAYIARFPNDTAGYIERGIIQEKQKDFEGQLESYEKALSLNNKQPYWLYINLARLLYKEGRKREAIDLYRQGFEQSPEEVDGLICAEFARLLSEQGKITESLNAYQQAIELDPTLEWVKFCIETLKYNRGIAKLSAGDIEGAGHCFLDVEQVKPSWETAIWFKNKETYWPYSGFKHLDRFESLKPASVGWPKISIVTPSLNQGKFLEDTILSVLNQGYENVEYIVIDGKSADSTVDVLDKYHNKISTLLIESDTGQSDAINKGFQIATGDLFGWLNSDDMLAPGALHKIALTYIKTYCDVIAGICVAHQDFEIEMVRKPRVTKENLTTDVFCDYERWKAGDLFFQPEVFFSRQLWEESGGQLNDNLYYAMDHELWTRFAMRNARVQIVDWPIGIFRKHDQQKTADNNASTEELLEVMKQYRVQEPKNSQGNFTSDLDTQQSSDSSSIEEYVSDICLLFEEEKWYEMLNVSQQMIQAYPNNANGYSWAGVAQEKIGDLKGQLANYKNALRLDRNQPEWLYLVVGRLLYEEERWDEAIVFLERGIELYPDSAEAYRSLGLCQERVGDIQEQLLNYQKALSLDKNQPAWVYAVLIRLLRSQQRLEEAVEVGLAAKEHFSKLSVEQAAIYFELAQVYADLGMTQQSIDTYRFTLELDENFLEAKAALDYSLYASVEKDVVPLLSSKEEEQNVSSEFERHVDFPNPQDRYKENFDEEHNRLLLNLHQAQEKLEKYRREHEEQTSLLEQQTEFNKNNAIASDSSEVTTKRTTQDSYTKDIESRLDRVNIKKYDSQTTAAKLAGFPPDLILPPIQGENNDYSFIESAVKERIKKGEEQQIPVSVIVPVHSNVSFTKKLVACLSVQTYPKSLFEVILVNSSDTNLDESELRAYRRSTNLTIVENPGSSSIGQIFNLGIKSASYDYAITLDADILPVPDLIQTYMDYFHVYENCVLLGDRKFLSADETTEQDIINSRGKIVSKLEEIDFGSRSWKRNQDKKLVSTSLDVYRNLRKDRYPFRAFSSANAAYSIKVLEKISLFDEDLRHAGYQDKEIGYRLFNSGSYFIPVVDSLGIHQDTHINRSERGRPISSATAKKLFEEKCPVSWDRKYEPNRLYEIPKVSIYIPSYNNGKYIKEAVESALNQTYTDLEVCICDDGSTDNTLEVLDTHFSNHPRVRWMSQENGGIGKASNSAVRMCRGMYIGQLDSDDILKSNAVETLVKYLDKNNIGCAYSSCERVDANGQYIMNEYSYPKFSREKMLMTSIAHHFRMFRKKDWLRTDGFSEELVNAVDYDMFLKLSEVCTFHHIEEFLYSRRWHGKNTSFVNEDKQSINTPKVITYSLERMNLSDVWEVYAPDKSQPRKLSFRRKKKRSNLFFFPDYRRSNTYQKLLYSHASDICSLYSGDIADALQALKDGLDNVTFHLHWTNYILRKSENEYDAERLRNLFLQKILTFLTLGGKLVWTIHNVIPHERKYLQQEVELRTVISSLASVVHVHSESALREIREHFPISEEKVRVAPHGHYIGVDENTVSRENARQRFGFSENETVFLFLGQIRAYKGIEELITAFSALVDRQHTARLLIAGSLKDNIDIEKLCRDKGILSRVVYVSEYIESRELQYYYNAADAVVLPYRKILTSGSLIHAMSFKRAVIAPSLGMIEETIISGYNGFMYKSGDLNELISVMINVCNLSKDECRILGENAYESIKKLGWRDIAMNILRDT